MFVLFSGVRLLARNGLNSIEAQPNHVPDTTTPTAEYPSRVCATGAPCWMALSGAKLRPENCKPLVLVQRGTSACLWEAGVSEISTS
jgi:hypothetical protein